MAIMGIALIYPQPILSDIEFDDSGNMILGFADRTGFQGGRATLGPNGETESITVAGGDILRAERQSDGTFLIGVPGPTDADAFFNDDSPGTNIHLEVSLGGIALLPGSNEVVMTAYDPIAGDDGTIFDTGGSITLNTQTGAYVRAFRIYSSSTTTFGKGNGLGDIELACDPAPLQLGNYVWLDANGDGVQDPCEEPVPGMTVKLYTKPSSGNAELVATTTTDADGEYYFTNNTTAGESWESGFSEVEVGADYYVVPRLQ